MNSTNDDRLEAAAREGDIKLLYTLIEEDPYVLEHIDSIPFVETPFHTAASMGHLQFATEVMMLKPSFAWKLNKQGFSPIHLAMQNGQKRMVLCFVDINKDLVRVKGRERLTPLHLASQIGEVDLLAFFLSVCPDSIEDVTVRCETALHIAVKSKQYEALQVLVHWLKTNCLKGATKLEKIVLNRKDEAGHTILHILALGADSQNLKALRLLVKTKINLNTKNLENWTALDIAASTEIKNILFSAGAKPGSEVTYAHKLTSKITVMDKMLIYILRIRRDVSAEQRSAFLIVATLVATTTYQLALSPPGGAYQVNAGDNYVNTTSLNSTTMATATQGNAGKSVLPGDYFVACLIFNTTSLLVSTLIICILTPGGAVGRLLLMAVFLLVYCYLLCMLKINPASTGSLFNSIMTVLVLISLSLCGVYLMFIVVYNRLQGHVRNREIETRNSARGNG